MYLASLKLCLNNTKTRVTKPKLEKSGNAMYYNSYSFSWEGKGRYGSFR